MAFSSDDESDEETRPRFFKVYISQFSSNSMLIPISYYNEFPYLLPKIAILQGSGGCVWKVAVEIKKKPQEVYFGEGWVKFVKDNSLTDGDFLTFVYNGESVYEVTIFGLDGCKEIRAVAAVEENGEEDSESNAIPRGKSNEERVEDSDSAGDDDDSEESEEDMETDTEIDNKVLIIKNKGKSKVVLVEDSDSDDSQNGEKDTDHEFKKANTNLRIKNKGKEKVEVSESSDDKDSDSDYTEAFSNLDVEDSSSSDSSYLPDSEDEIANVKQKTRKLTKQKGKSKIVEEEADAVSDSSAELSKKKKKLTTKIKNPEAYLDNPKNVYFETAVKNRPYELLVHAQLVKDYCLKFPDTIKYKDPKGELEAKTAKWKDQRVCIKKWHRILKRNKLKKKDRVLCEILRVKSRVYAIKLHIFKEADL